jgi:DNA-directed RNA polymerase alpha subunit
MPNIEYIRSDVAEARANAKAAAVLVIACATLLDRLTVYGTDNAYEVVRDVFDNIQLKGTTMAMEDVNLDLSIDELELSVRAWNIMKAMNVKTIGQAISLRERDYLRDRYCGLKTLNCIKGALAQFGLRLREDDHV